MRTSSWIGLGLAAVTAGFYESSLLSSAPFPLNIIKPIFPACIMMMLLNRPTAAYVGVAIAGLIADLLAPVPLGFAAARWLIVLVCADAISERVMTNRSMYAAAILVASARLLDAVLAEAGAFVSKHILERTVAAVAWPMLWQTVAADILMTGMVFLGVTVFTRRFLVSVRSDGSRYAP